MKRILLLLVIAAQALLSPSRAHAQADYTIDTTYRVGVDSIKVVFHKNRPDSSYAQFEFNTDSNYVGTSGIVSFAYFGNTTGTFSRTYRVLTGLRWYARIVHHDSAGIRYDTSNVSIMFRRVTVVPTNVATDTGFTYSVTFDAGNKIGAKWRQIIASNPSFTGVLWRHDSLANTVLGGTMTRVGVVSSFSFPDTLWVKDIISNGFSTDSVITRIVILPLPAPPTVDSSAAAVSTNVTAVVQFMTDVHSVSSTLTLVTKDSLLHTVDSIVYLPTMTSGAQYFTRTVTALTANTRYKTVATVTNVYGIDTARSMFRTQTEFSLRNDTLVQHHDTLHSVLSYTNVIGHVADFTAYLRKAGLTVQSQYYSHLPGSSSVTKNWIITDTGWYSVYARGADTPGYTIKTTDTLYVHVLGSRIDSFYATSDTIVTGSTDTLRWVAANSLDVNLSGFGTVAEIGSYTTGPITAIRTYTLTTTSVGGALVRRTLTIVPMPLTRIDTFYGVPDTVLYGGSSTVSWSTSNATSALLAGGTIGGSISLSGSRSTGPLYVTTTYTITATGYWGSVTRTRTIVVRTIPIIDSFYANRDTVYVGDMDTLHWHVTNATAVDISSVGSVSLIGLMPTPHLFATTSYTLTATVAGNTVTRTITVHVIARPTLGLEEMGGTIHIHTTGTLRVYNMNGQVSYSQETKEGDTFDKRDFTPGVYIMELITNEGSFRQKIAVY